MKPVTKAYICLAFVCIVWGTTYLALAVGVKHFPAFLFAGSRQTVSGLILMGFALVANRNKDLSRRNIFRQMLVGFLMLTLGNGCVTWAEKVVPSGVAALICSSMPIFAVVFNLAMGRSEKLNLLIGGGMLLGAVGVGIIFRESVGLLSNSEYLLGMLALVLATASWAMGSVINKKDAKPVNPFLNSGMQLFFGGIFMLLISPFTDDYSTIQMSSSEGWLALLYLIVFGSVLTYAAYMYTLSKLPMGIATIYAYINPLVAVVLGYFILHEPLSIFTGLAFATIAISVFMVNKGYRIQQKLITETKPAGPFPETAIAES